MSLSECDRITVPASEIHQFSFTRGNCPLTPQLSLDQAADAGEFAHSLELLRSTSLHLSLFRIVLPDLQPEDAFQVVTQAFEKRGMICRLPEDRFVLLLIGTDLDERFKSLGAKHVVVFGISTDMCVSTTVRMGANLGWDMVLVPDACDCFDLPNGRGGTIPAEEIQRAHVATLAFEFCRIVPTAELTALRAAA